MKDKEKEERKLRKKKKKEERKKRKNKDKLPDLASLPDLGLHHQDLNQLESKLSAYYAEVEKKTTKRLAPEYQPLYVYVL